MTEQQLAQDVKRLVSDPTYTAIMDEVRARQMAVFGNPASTPEAILEAHSVIRALGKIDGTIRSIMNAASVATKKENQDRGCHD